MSVETTTSPLNGPRTMVSTGSQQPARATPPVSAAADSMEGCWTSNKRRSGATEGFYAGVELPGNRRPAQEGCDGEQDDRREREDGRQGRRDARVRRVGVEMGG